jgi:hypothetical protein
MGTIQMSGWTNKATTFLDCAFSRLKIVRCPGAHVADARIRGAWRTREPLPYICVRSYEVWAFHSESSTRVIAEDEHDCDVGDVDRIDEMLEAIQAEVNEDPPTAEVEAFFKLLKASEELLHEYTEVTLLTFITRLMAIKSKYFFSNNCYNDIMKLINDILSKPHRVPKDMYQSKKMMYALDLKYEKIGVCPDNRMLF